MPSFLGKSNSFNGLKSALDQPEFTTAIGLVKFGSFQQQRRAGAGILRRGLKSTLGEWFKRR
jgi:hypothetical protein